MDFQYSWRRFTTKYATGLPSSPSVLVFLLQLGNHYTTSFVPYKLREQSPTAGKIKHAPPCSSEELFFAETMGATDIGFPGFFSRFLASTTCLDGFPLRPEEVSRRFSFGGGGVSFFYSLQQDQVPF